MATILEMVEPKLLFGCARCDERWNGKKTSHCGGCHETFSTPSTFDIHRRNGECLNPAFLQTLVRQGRAGYAVWGYPKPEAGLMWENGESEEDDD